MSTPRRRRSYPLMLLTAATLVAVALPTVAGAEAPGDPAESASIGPVIVELEKRWISESEVTLDQADAVTLRSHSDEAGEVTVETVSCGFNDGTLERSPGIACEIEVPAGGSYSVEEAPIDGFHVVAGVGTFQPGDSDFCLDGPLGDPALGASTDDPLEVGHCLVNEELGARTLLVQKRWQGRDGSSVDGGTVTLTAFGPGDSVAVDTVTCTFEAGVLRGPEGSLPGPGGPLCLIEVPGGGSYTVDEELEGWRAVGGVGRFDVDGLGRLPQAECPREPSDDILLPLSARETEIPDDDDIRFHCITNEPEEPEITIPVPVPVPTAEPEPRGTVIVTKELAGSTLPPAIVDDLEFEFTVTCDGVSETRAIGAGDDASFGPFDVDDDSACSIMEGPLPALPDGFAWGDPIDLEIELGSGENAVTATNTVGEVPEVGGEVVSPPAQAPTTPTTTAPPQAAPTTLPVTGSDTDMALAALVILTLGAGLVLVARRREGIV